MTDEEVPTVACPICNGPLSTDATGWRCEVGHHYSFTELAKGQRDASVRALWYALRSLEDRAISSKFAASRYRDDGLARQADQLVTQSIEDLAMVDQLHSLLKGLHGDERPAPERSISHREPPGQGSHS